MNGGKAPDHGKESNNLSVHTPRPYSPELTPQDIAENVVVKIADEVEVDVSRQARQVRCADAIATAEAIPIEGVRVPFLSLEMPVKSKTTCRGQDRADLVRLRDLLELKRQRRDAAS